MQKRRTRKGKNNKGFPSESILAVGFGICILGLAAINLFWPDHEMSEQENRMLASKPKLSVSSVLSGDYMEKYESYLADQFAGRDFLRNIKVTLGRFGGNKDENGVLLGKQGQLLEEIEVPDQTTLKANLTAIRQFAEQNDEIPTYMMLVPDAAAVLDDTLPSLAVVSDQSRMIAQVKRELGDSVTWIDAESVLNKHAGEKIYYKTDPHWTSLGAFYVFQAVAETLKIDGEAGSNFVSYPISKTFNGTLASASGFRLNEREVIDMYVSKEEDGGLVVNYVEEQEKTASIYDSSKLKTRDQYGVFLGGNTSLIDIKTVSESQRRLLLVKDSFANSFVPFLTPYFREIVVVDPRYYSGTIEDLMNAYRITDTMFLYSGNSFFQDNNISGVLDSEQ